MNRPQQHTAISEAAEAVWRAEHYRALGLLHKLDAPGAVALRMSVLRRAGQLDLALAEFAAHRLADFEPAEAVTAGVLAALSLCDRLEIDRAAAIVASLEPIARASADPLLEIALHWIAAVVAFHASDVRGSERLLLAALASIEEHPRAEAHAAYQPELNHLRARCLSALGSIAAAAGDLRRLEQCNLDAILCVRLVRNKDLWLEAFLLANLAALVAQFPNARPRQLLVARAAEIPWNYALDAKYDYVKNGLLQHRLLFGDASSSGGTFSDSAHSLAWRLNSCVRRLQCDDFENAADFEGELAFARSIADRVDFALTQGEEVVAARALATFLAPGHGRLADELMGRYLEKMSVLTRTWIAVHAPVRDASEAFARGCFAKARKSHALAATEFATSAQLWSRLEVPQWVATAGLERFTISRDERDLDAARAFVARFGETRFGRRLRRALAAAPASDVADFIYLDPWRLAARDP